MQRWWRPLAFLLLGALIVACKGGAGEPGNTKPSRLPSSMAALGDSITAGLGSCLTLVVCRRNSWATGSAASVDSHYRRIRADNPAIRGNARNYAVPGARAADLEGQAGAAVRAKVSYVTVLIGANDVCVDRVQDMTPVGTFRRQVDAALDRLRAGLPSARILIVSIPDLYRLWELGHDDARAVRAWNRGVCPALLADPTSTADADERRRRQVDDRVDAYNTELEAACDAYGRRCRTDGGSAHRVRFTLDLVNRVDYFHPDADGQRTLAEVTWSRRW